MIHSTNAQTRTMHSIVVAQPSESQVQVALAESDAQIASTLDVMRQLRPHLVEETYVERIRALMASERFRLAMLSDEGRVRAVAGYRYVDMLHCGRALSVDDLAVDERARSRGYGSMLLGWLKEEGRRHGCTELHLDSGVARERAHRFYLREGLGIEGFHFQTTL